VAMGTSLPRVSDEVIEGIIHANPFEHWWHGSPPMSREGPVRRQLIRTL
jgi:hypothetical protein